MFYPIKAIETFGNSTHLYFHPWFESVKDATEVRILNDFGVSKYLSNKVLLFDTSGLLDLESTYHVWYS